MKIKILILLLVTVSLFSQEKETILISQNQFGFGKDNIEPNKIKAGLVLAINMTEKYSTVTDSTINEYLNVNQPESIYKMAKDLDVDYISFSRVDVFENMLKSSLSIISVDDSSTKYTGEGFANIRFKKEKGNKPIYDPAILTSFQRSFQNAMQDSSLYSHQPDKFNVKPQPTIVIGGFEFADDEAKYEWEMYSNKTVSSYYASEALFESMKKSNEFVVYDLATRDSMYAQFNFYMVENNKEPGQTELKILNGFNVDYYVFGKITRVDEYAEVEIFLTRIKPKTLELIKKEKMILREDRLSELAVKIDMLVTKITSVTN